MEAIRTLLEHQPLMALFLTVAVGYLVGEINIKGFSLGVGAVLFVALAVGWFAPKSVPAAMGKAVWIRYVLVPGLTDDPANVEGVAKFVAPMTNVEWVEVLPFHQLGAFKWKELGLEYELTATPPASPELLVRVLGQFRDAGCNAR